MLSATCHNWGLAGENFLIDILWVEVDFRFLRRHQQVKYYTVLVRKAAHCDVIQHHGVFKRLALRANNVGAAAVRFRHLLMA